MNFGVLFEKVTDKDFPSGYYYAHVPSLGLTRHGSGIEGAREAATDLLRLWIAEKHACGESQAEFRFFDNIYVMSLKSARINFHVNSNHLVAFR